MTKDEALKLVLGKIKSAKNCHFKAIDTLLSEAEEILEQGLAEPVQEPVAYAVYHRMGGSKTLHWPEHHSEDGDANEYKLVPLYANLPPAPIKWSDYESNGTHHNKPTQEEIQRLRALVRAQQMTIDKLEAALAQPEQEPVGEVVIESMGVRGSDAMQVRIHFYKEIPPIKSKVYTTPPQREWVGLTPADFDKLEQLFGNKVSNDFVLADIFCTIEAKLRSKNEHL